MIVETNGNKPNESLLHDISGGNADHALNNVVPKVVSAKYVIRSGVLTPNAE
jgi:hypothetical protein